MASMSSSERQKRSQIPMQRNGDYLVVQLPENPDGDDVGLMCQELLRRVHSTSLRGVVIDCERTALIDSSVAVMLNEVARPIALLGYRTAICGLSSGLSSALTRMDVSLDALIKAQDIDHALAQLAEAVRSMQ